MNGEGKGGKRNMNTLPVSALIFALSGSICVSQAHGPRPYPGTHFTCPGLAFASPFGALLRSEYQRSAFLSPLFSGSTAVPSAGSVAAAPNSRRGRHSSHILACSISGWSDEPKERGRGDFGRRFSSPGRGQGRRWTVRRADDGGKRISGPDRGANGRLHQQRRQSFSGQADREWGRSKRGNSGHSGRAGTVRHRSQEGNDRSACLHTCSSPYAL